MPLAWLALGCARPPLRPEPNDPSDAWFEVHRIPLGTVDPTADPGALEPLGPILGERRVVALGESTHGTGEFFRVKDRLIRWLVAEHGVTVVALEVPYETGCRLDDWIHGGDGDGVDLLRGTWWWLDAGEIAELMQWLRGWADQHPIALVGFDVQGAERSAAALASDDPETAAILVEVAAGRVDQLPDLERASTLVGVLGSADPRTADRAAIVREAIDLVRYCGAKAGCRAAGREAYMAENVARVLDRDPATKAVVWAHNDHVAHVTHPDGWSSMGELLRASLPTPADLYAVALDFDGGSFVAPAGGVGATDVRALPHLHGFQVATYGVDPAPPALAAHVFAAVSDAPWFVDLSGAPDDVRAQLATHPLHDYGAAVPDGTTPTDPDPLPDGWDGVLFVGQGHAFTFLP